MKSSAISFRKAEFDDLKAIIHLLYHDELGQARESLEDSVYSLYERAFKQISKDPNQYLLVAESDDKILGTCHLTFMPSLTFQGSKRMNIEAVRVQSDWRSCGLGEKMLQHAIKMARDKECKLVQLATNTQRQRAKKFYEKLGFEATHVGMRMYLKDEGV